ncbi:MAG TPA: amino acid adenylation domain-containing protein, partial [Thermoanaerobaculia bacterium]
YVAPRNEAETQLVEIWAQVLKLDPATVGVHDNFFELGGHSLLATQLIAKIRSRSGVDVPLKALFERATIAQFAELIGGAEKSDVPAMVRVDRSRLERLPLSFVQERLWFIDQLEPNSAGYNVPVAFVLRGALDVDGLEEAFRLIIERHETLRTIFPSEEGQARQVIVDHVDFQLGRFDLRGEGDREAKVRAICQTDAVAPFDLATGPLFRGKVIQLADEEHVLFLNMHHIVSDGWSLGVMIRELGLILDGRAAELPVLPIQYADFSVWQRQWLEEGGALAQQLAYWKEKLAGVPESLDLVTDYPRPSVQSLEGATYEFALDPQVTAQLKALAEQQGGTLFMILLAAFNALLHRYTGQNDICVGSPIANRQYEETEGLIGMFANTLALRSTVDADESFASLLAKVRATCLEAYQYQDTPFEKIVEMLQPERNLAITPIFQIMLVLQNVDTGALDPRFPRYSIDSNVSKFDLTAAFSETADGLSAAIEYSTALFKPETIARMAEHFSALCNAIVATPAAKIRDLELLGQAEKHRLLVDFNDTAADYPAGELLHQRFVAQAASNATKTAVVCGEASLTYGQLEERSRTLALHLQSAGVQPDALVAVCMERSLDMLVAMLGILRSGGAYVPLDPEYPHDRLAYMIQDSRAAIVLTQESLREKLTALVPAGTRLMALDTEWPSAEGELRHDVQPHHLAYIIYTSGSTGQPKGVAIEHHSPVTLVQWATEVYSAEELSAVLASTSICFDLSVYEIFVTLSNGGTVHLVPNALELLQRPLPVTLINTVPSAMEELVRANAIPASVQTINLAGEPLSTTLVNKIYESSTTRKVFDLYGPSEDTTYSTYTLRVKNAPATIGRPIANTQVYILDRFGNVQPIGVPGELHIGGDGLARGYLYRPELTSEKFIANPFTPGTRMYRTGDLARWQADGTLQYLGRIDTQVKVRGFRIELGEIEARLAEHDGIQDCAVVAQGEAANKRLVAFYRPEANELPFEELRAHLLRTLPEYMVPAAFVSLAAIPLTPNGKIDRRALSRMEVSFASARDYVAPRNEAETQLVEIWAQVLKLDPAAVGVHDNFFELGGHSLLATQLIAKIRSRSGVDVPLKALFERATIAQFAELIGGAEKSDVPAMVRVDRSRLERLPLSFVQERLWFIDQLEPNSAGYNVPVAFVLRGALDADRLEEALRLIIERHETLRTIFPSEEGQARQVIVDAIEFLLERVDLRAENDREQKARTIVQTDALVPFDLAVGPLFRAKVIQLADEEHVLFLNMHHIVSDGWSLGVMIRELGLILDGRAAELPVLPIQYADYSVWQRQWLEEGGALAQQLAYWKEKLAGVPESLDLVTDYPRPSVQSLEGAT